MVTHDPPLAVDLPEKEGIDAADIAGLSFQQPFTDDKVIIRGKRLDFKQGEEQLAHLVGVAVVLLIMIEGLLVAIRDAGMADEHEGVVIPIALHEIVDVAHITCGGLVGHQLPDGGLGCLCKAAPGEQQQAGADQCYLHDVVLPVIYSLCLHFLQ